MNREILFKAKDKETNEWIEGTPITAENGVTYIAKSVQFSVLLSGNAGPLCNTLAGDFYSVIPETVSQFTGLYDKNGVRIWENDIVKMIIKSAMNPAEPPLIFIGVCKFKDGSFGFSRPRAGVEVFTAFSATFNVDFEVIGNRFDNPDLLN